MALIGQIRKRSWILIVMVGIGLGGFIFMDYSSAKSQGGGATQNELGKVNGEKVSRQKFEQVYSLLYSNASGDANGRRSFLWNYFVEEAVVKEEASNLGLGVSATELKDLEFGPTPSRIIVQRFSNANAPGQVDRAQLDNIKQIIESGTIDEAINNRQLSAEFIPYWQHQEQEIIKDRLQTKIDKLVEKAMYTPSWMTSMGYEEKNQFVDFAYAKVPYDEIDPTEASLSAADYDAYVNENAELFRQDEESRVLNFVTFEIAPTEADRAACSKKLADLIEGFAKAENDSSYVLRYRGTIDAAYVKKASINAAIADTLFALNIGDIYGPYEEAGVYRIAKIRGRQVIPDSVKSRHILRQVQSFEQLTQARKTIDSLKTLIENGIQTFDSLAVAFGTDATASKGGDLGYAAVNGMVKPFNDLIFFEAKVGELRVVETQYGVHLVEVTDKKFINNEEGLQLAYLSEDIIPSDDTRNAVYDKATAFAGQNAKIADMLSAAEADASLTVETAGPLKINDYSVGTLGATDDARDMIKWSFTAGRGDVSPDVYVFKDQAFSYDNKYVVVGVKAIQKAGVPSSENIKEQIETAVLNKKRAEMIMAQIGGMNTGAVASKYSVPVDTAKNVYFGQLFAGDLGSEPAVIASAFTLDQGASSSAIEGKTGVYVITVINKPAMATPSGLSQIRQTMTAEARRKMSGQLIQSMLKNADVSDNRSTFY